MSTGTRIEWTNATWNPTTGCDKVSPGCDHCYALTMAARLKAAGQPKYQRDGNPATSGPGFGLSTHADALSLPFTWRKPRRVFVNSMSDLFHDEIPETFLVRVFAVMAATPKHTYQVLTKRHGRMRSLLGKKLFAQLVLHRAPTEQPNVYAHVSREWPLPNVWLGVSVENQQWADIRIPALLETPAAVRWVSAEPLLGPLTLWRHLWSTPCPNGCGCRTPDAADARECACDGPCCTDEWAPKPSLQWLVVGGESGPQSRPMQPDWARSLRDDCAGAGVPFYFKQWGGRTPKAGGRELDGRTWDEYPDGGGS